MVRKELAYCMSNINVSVIILAILVYKSTTAVQKIETCISLKHEITFHSNGESSVSSQDPQMLCSYRYQKILTCQQGEPLLTAGYCATYNDHTKLISILECPYFEPNDYNNTSQGSVLLPKNVSQLNDYMCGPLNRKGLVWDTKSDIIDVFNTFFYLTYSKVLYQTLLLITNKPIRNIELSG